MFKHELKKKKKAVQGLHFKTELLISEKKEE